MSFDDNVAAVDRQYDAMIAQSGHAIQGVCDGVGEVFQYTIGRWEKNLPEFVITGVDHRTGAGILNYVLAQLGSRPLTHRMIDTEIMEPPSRFDQVKPEWVVENMSASIRRIGSHDHINNVFQLVWPDRNGRYPDDPNFDHPSSGQFLVGL